MAASLWSYDMADARILCIGHAYVQIEDGSGIKRVGLAVTIAIEGVCECTRQV